MILLISEFPAFQEHILSNGLGPLVIEVAKNDNEFYVRATALNCISKMIPVKLLWEQCFSTFDLIVREKIQAVFMNITHFKICFSCSRT